ncbi:hypothetical protein TNCV_2257811 [Trichonephila clavipes]|nr:hypothetical protein TNCV_2257811 [Trichonephila clavipes]
MFEITIRSLLVGLIEVRHGVPYVLEDPWHITHLPGCYRHSSDEVGLQLKDGHLVHQTLRMTRTRLIALGKSCTLQWIPAHVDIEGSEMADSSDNEARALEPIPSSTTVFDANAVAKQKLCSKPILHARIKL